MGERKLSAWGPADRHSFDGRNSMGRRGAGLEIKMVSSVLDISNLKRQLCLRVKVSDKHVRPGTWAGREEI